MTIKEKIAKIRRACTAAHPGLLGVDDQIQLRHILKAFRLKELKYTIGSEGDFIGPASLVATTKARWQPLDNDLIKQDDRRVEFRYLLFKAHDSN